MTSPLSTTGTYQLVILGHDGDVGVTECTSRLDHALDLALSNLGVSRNKLLTRLISGSTSPILDRRMPTVAVFFGLQESPTLSGQDEQRLATLLGDGVLLIPVVENIARFSTLVPTGLSSLNGVAIADCGTAFERLASRVLEGFQLLRKTRRLFISYRRVETSGVAAQLYEDLDAAGFDVFLDTHGVLRPGEPFQEILWHRLADTNVAVVLDSPGFMESRWTEEELARANSSNIQVLQVFWPGQKEGANPTPRSPAPWGVLGSIGHFDDTHMTVPFAPSSTFTTAPGFVNGFNAAQIYRWRCTNINGNNPTTIQSQTIHRQIYQSGGGWVYEFSKSGYVQPW